MFSLLGGESMGLALDGNKFSANLNNQQSTLSQGSSVVINSCFSKLGVDYVSTDGKMAIFIYN